MVEKVEELEADGQHTMFQMGDTRILHDREVGVEVARCTITVTALRKSHSGPVQTLRELAQGPGIKPCLATCLYKERSWIG